LLSFIIILFFFGYFLIALEHSIGINKAASALLLAVILWILFVFQSSSTYSPHALNELLMTNMGEISEILFFLLGAMTIVELIDAHDGFSLVTQQIKTKNTLYLAWLISFITFILSAVLDNLTTAIVMTSLVRKIIPPSETRLKYVGLIVIAANAGGAWSPIGDVTTTMLWIGGQITAGKVILNLFIPSLVCLLVPLMLMSKSLKGQKVPVAESIKISKLAKERYVIFYCGLGVLLFVPFFKSLTHLPPFMGVLFGVGLLWVITGILHKKKNEEEKSVYSVMHALQKIDTSSILFFLGILLSVNVLQNTGLLKQLALNMSDFFGDYNLIAVCLGALSSVVDNVPLVAAAIGMYPLEIYPVDHTFWHMLAYATGTGGSALIIGSAAGVAVMGLEDITFTWYLKKMSLLAFAGFLSGALIFWLLN
jgi:Na+/H+ antiporter NhaD/arsenite permease-like protein